MTLWSKYFLSNVCDYDWAVGSICHHPGQCCWMVGWPRAGNINTNIMGKVQRWLYDTGSLSRWQVSLCHDMVTPIPHNMGHMLTRPSKLQMVRGRVKLYLHSDGGTHVSTLLNRIHNNQLSPLPPLTRQTRNVLCDRCDELFHVQPSFWLPRVRT